MILPEEIIEINAGYRKDTTTNSIVCENCLFTMRNLAPKYTLCDIAEVWLYAAYHMKVNPNEASKKDDIETRIVWCLNNN